MIRDGAVDVRLLAVEGLGGAARWQMIPFVRASVDDGREEFMDARQPFCPILVIFSQRLAEHELPPISEIAGIEPVMKPPRLEARDTGDRRSCCAGVNTRDEEVGIGHILSAMDEVRNRFPVEPPEQVQSVDQHYSLIQPNFRPA